MLRIVESGSSGHAKSYFKQADYYIEGQEQELTGQWKGRAAARLGLSGAIDEKSWTSVCDNVHPETGQQLTPRQKQDRRVGYDFVFSAPKSFSLLYAISEDERLLTIFRDAVDATMQEIEADMKTRVRSKGRDEDRVTGNMVWGEFVHFTARPIDGIPDPHLHAHCFTHNLTWDSEEERWKAGQFGDIKADAPYYEGRFKARLGHEMLELGIQLEPTTDGWEVATLGRETIERFSRRTVQIEKEATARKITDPEWKAGIGAQIREKKAKNLTMGELGSVWKSRMTKAELAAIQRTKESIGKGRVRGDRDKVAESIGQAADHIFERHSTISERRLMGEAFKRAAGKASLATIEQEFARKGFVTATRSGKRIATTREVLAEEKEMLDFARAGRGTCRPLAYGHHQPFRSELNVGQRRAVEHVLNSRDLVTIVRGVAGVGKSKSLQEISDWIGQYGRKVYAFAPSAKASRGALRKKGFEDADTVAKLAADPKLQEKVRGNIILVDEAGLLGSKDMLQFFTLAKALDARIVLTGDRYQHGSVSRGSALRQLETEAGLVSVEITEIMRQKGDFKQVVTLLANGKAGDAFQKLDDLGWVKELPNDDREHVLADDYVELAQRGRTVQVISPSHADGNKVARTVREALKTAGLIKGDEHRLVQLVNSNFTESERRDAHRYRENDVLVFSQNVKGIRKGSRILAASGELPLDHADRFQVYHQATLKVAEGETLRVTRNGRTLDGKRIENGDLIKVKSFDDDGNLVTSKGLVTKDYGFLTQGYVSTSIAAQGDEVDNVLISQTWESRGASSAEQLYVSVSRGRLQATLYVDNKEEVMQAIGRSSDRMTASDMLGVSPQRFSIEPEERRPTRDAPVIERGYE